MQVGSYVFMSSNVQTIQIKDSSFFSAGANGRNHHYNETKVRACLMKSNQQCQWTVLVNSLSKINQILLNRRKANKLWPERIKFSQQVLLGFGLGFFFLVLTDHN